MPEVKKVMEKDANGIDRQIFPETVPEAIIGLNDLMAGESNVLSVNGKIGVVVITKEDLGLENAITELPFASEESDGIITAEMYLKILNSGGGAGSDGHTAILLEPYKGDATQIIQMGGDGRYSGVNISTIGYSFGRLLAGDRCIARAVK